MLQHPLQSTIDYNLHVKVSQPLAHVMAIQYNPTKAFHLIWYLLHSLTFLYPNEPSERQQQFMTYFVTSIVPLWIPKCNKCQNHYKSFLSSHDLQKVTQTKHSIVNYFIELHNDITLTRQQKLVLPDPTLTTYTYEQAEAQYSSNDYLTYIHDTYNVDVTTLFLQALNDPTKQTQSALTNSVVSWIVQVLQDPLPVLEIVKNPQRV